MFSNTTHFWDQEKLQDALMFLLQLHVHLNSWPWVCIEHIFRRRRNTISISLNKQLLLACLIIQTKIHKKPIHQMNELPVLFLYNILTSLHTLLNRVFLGQLVIKKKTLLARTVSFMYWISPGATGLYFKHRKWSTLIIP